ncbi:glycosyltransferase family 2 protein [Chloroflexota bacterium]
MYKNFKIGVVITVYNEESFIEDVIMTIPSFVDIIYAIDDGSTDGTPHIFSSLSKTNERLKIITHDQNNGVGAGKISGYWKSLEDDMGITVMMAGDGQTDPAYLDKIIDPVAEGLADYSKGARLSSAENRQEMPALRLIGNFLLTWLTRIASGYWHISDPQDGYTAISRETLKKLDLNGIHKRWPAENDILVKLNVIGARVVDVPHPAVYHKDLRSKIRYPYFIISTSWLLLRSYFWRLWVKYLNRFPLKS